MKKWILILIALPALLWAQPRTTVMPNHQGSVEIMSQIVTGATTPVWSDAFSIRNIEGATVLFFNTDTTDVVREANESDSCMTVFLQIKDNDIGWTRYYTDANAYTRLDSVNRDIVNTAGANDFRIHLAEFTAWGSGDSARVGVTIGTGDTLTVTIRRQGI